MTDSFFVATDFNHVNVSKNEMRSLLPENLPKRRKLTERFISTRSYRQWPDRGEVQLCGMKDATTASFVLAANDLEERSLHEKMVMRVTCELLGGFEGCLWRAIRGRGLAYDFGL